MTLYYQVDPKKDWYWEFSASDDIEARRIADVNTSVPYLLTAFAQIVPGIGKQFFVDLGIALRELGTIWLGDLHPAF